MLGIEWFCGSKYGGWKLGRDRFESAPAAEAAMLTQIAAEARSEGLNPIARRIVPA